MGKRNKDADLERLADAFFKNLQINDIEYGGIGLDGKRPFGNGYVEGDILEIIGWDSEGEDEYTNEQEEYANSLYSALPKYMRKQWKKRKPGKVSQLPDAA